MLYINFAYLIGTYIGVYFNVKPLFFILFIAVFLIYFLIYKSKRKMLKILLFILFFILAIIRVDYIKKIRSEFLNINSSQNLYIIKILSKEKKEYSNVYIAKIEVKNNSKKKNNNKDNSNNNKELNFIKYFNKNFKIEFKSKENLNLTKRYIVHGNIELFNEEYNFKGFNSRKHYYSKGIDFKFNLADDEIQIVENTRNSNSDYLILFKEKLTNEINDYIKNNDIFNALFLGNKNYLDEELISDFKELNIYHILAMSGMHIGTLVLVLNFIFNKSKIKIRFRIKKFIKIMVLILYMMLVGISSSVSRAVLIVIISLVFEEFNIRYGFVNSIFLSIFIILIINPYTIYNPAFYLSYIATISIYFFLNIEKNLKLFVRFVHKLGVDKSYNWQERDSLIRLEERQRSRKKFKNTNKLKNTKKSIDKNNNTSTNKNKIRRPYIKRFLNIVFYNLYISVVVYISLFPLLIYFFGEISVNFFLANLLIAPIFPILMFLGFTFIILLTMYCIISTKILLFLISRLSEIIDTLINIFLKLVDFSKLGRDSNLQYFKQTNLLFVISYYIMLFLFFYSFSSNRIFKNRSEYINNGINKIKRIFDKQKILIITIIIILLFSNIFLDILELDGKFKISFIYVGQGDSSLITTPSNRTILIDTGDNSYFDNGNEIRRYIFARGKKSIDHLFISHFDSDHIGGVYTLIEGIKIKKIYIPKYIGSYLEKEIADKYGSINNEVIDRLKEELSNKENSKTKTNYLEEFLNYYELKLKAESKDIELIELERGNIINIDKYTDIAVLFPTKDLIKKNLSNNNSLVFKVNCKNKKKNKIFSILYTGDIEKEAILELLKYDKSNRDALNIFALKSDILKIPHHGSKSSFNEELIRIINPKIAIISAGKNNIYRHPHREVLDLLKEIKTKIYRTDIDGEIYLEEKTIFSY